MTRRVRPTFLLKLATLGVGVALWLVVFLVTTSTEIRFGVIVALLIAWVVGLELGLVPEALERLIMKARGRKEGPLESKWVVDVAAEEKREMEQLRDGLDDNPTLR